MARRAARASRRRRRNEPDAPVVIYTLPACSYCSKAKRLLHARGMAYEEVVAVPTADFRRQLVQLTGRATVPQIIAHGQPIGGYKQLALLDALGILAPRLDRASFPLPFMRRRLSPLRLARAGLSMVGGGSCSPWLYEVRLLDEDGEVVDRHRVSSRAEAEELMDALGGEAAPLTA